MPMSTHAVSCLAPHGFHRVVYTQWGAPTAKRVLICVHGLTRNGRDFDFLAPGLEDRWRVICPDVAGRGQSDRLTRVEDYNNLKYVADMATLIARLDVEEVDWLGTSMGGLMGMLMASMPGNPIRRLIVNDVGPFIPKPALERIDGYVGRAPVFDDFEGVIAYLRGVHAGFGRLTDAQWHHLAEHGSRRLEDRRYALAYDPAIGDAFRLAPLEDVDLWSVWDRIQCPVLVLRGAESDLLLADTAQEMTRRGPKATLIEIPECGHAPALMDPAQIAVVRDWLMR